MTDKQGRPTRTIRVSDGTSYGVYEGIQRPKRPAARRGQTFPIYEAFDQLQPGETLLMPGRPDYSQRDEETFWAPKFRDRIRKRIPGARPHTHYHYGAQGGLLFSYELPR